MDSNLQQKSRRGRVAAKLIILPDADVSHPATHSDTDDDRLPQQKSSNACDSELEPAEQRG